MTTTEVASSPNDTLAIKLLSGAPKSFPFVSWQRVASAIPPLRGTGGVRTFVGSRGSAVDTTINDAGEDAAGYGFPPAASYVFNLSNIADGGAAMRDPRRYIDYSKMADGLVGGELPVAVFYYPVLNGSEYLPENPRLPKTGSR